MTSSLPSSAAAALRQQLTPPTAATGGEVGRRCVVAGSGSSSASTTSPLFSFAIRKEDNHPFIIVSSSDDDEVDMSSPPFANHMKNDQQQHCHEESDDEVLFIRSGDCAPSWPRVSSPLALSPSSRSSSPRSVNAEEALSRPFVTSSSTASILSKASVAITATSQRLSQRQSSSSPWITDTYYGTHSGASPVRGDHQQQQQPLVLGMSLPPSPTPCLPPLTPPAAATAAVVLAAASVPRLLEVPVVEPREDRSSLREFLAPLYSRDAFYTREGFESCLHTCFPSSQWLSPGEFWWGVPPEEVRYLGEGSFGLAWRVSSVFLKRHLAYEDREHDDGGEVEEETPHHHHHHYQTVTAAGAAYYSTSSSTTTPTTTGATQQKRVMKRSTRRAKASGIMSSTAMDGVTENFERDAFSLDDDSSKKRSFVCIKASPIRLHSRAAREDAITVLAAATSSFEGHKPPTVRRPISTTTTIITMAVRTHRTPLPLAALWTPSTAPSSSSEEVAEKADGTYSLSIGLSLMCEGGLYIHIHIQIQINI